MPLTEEQRKALEPLRAARANSQPALGVAKTFEERARLPLAGVTPGDITVRVELAPPSSNPLPLLPSSALKVPERVPIFFYSFCNDKVERHINPGNVKIIFHIHAGGNVTGHPAEDYFINFFAEILRAVASQSGEATTQWMIVAPCYRLATLPENSFPAALQDLVSAYDYIIDKGYQASNIIISGDSAGGNHALVLSYLASQSSRPMPNGVVVLAPASIQVYDRLSEHAKAQASIDIVPIRKYELMTAAYVGDSGVAPADRLVSGSYIQFPNPWPRTLILVGTGDQMIDASRELERRLSDINQAVELVEYDEIPHLWWLMGDIFPEELQDTVQRIAQFCSQI